MGFSLNKLVKVGTLGLADDLFGTEAAAKAGLQGQREGMSAEKEMFEKGLSFQKEMWDWQKGQAAPWTKAGLGALSQYQDTLNQGFTFDPSGDQVYQARVAELDKNLARSQAARGMKLSGSTLTSLRDITAGELGASYGRQYGAYQDKLSNLGNLINIGTGSSMNLSNIGQGLSGSIGQGYSNLGSSLAQGYQNMGAIRAQAAVAPFQNLMSLGQTAGGLMMGAGAMGYKPFGVGV